MRHYEEFEMEHLLNGTGSWLFRFLCRRHLRHCEVCRKRYENLLAGNGLLRRIRTGLERMGGAGLPAGKTPEERDGEAR